MKELGKKKQKNLAKGAGLLLALLRQNDASTSKQNSNETESDIELNLMHSSTCSLNFEQECEALTDQNLTSNPEPESNIINDTEATLKQLLRLVEERCSPTFHQEGGNLFFGYADYRFDRYTEFDQVWHENDAFSVSPSNYIKGAKWSPNGLHLLVSSNDRRLRTYTLPNCYANKSTEQLCSLQQTNAFNTGELVYDFCWFPYQCHFAEYSSLFAYTCGDQPIHLRDINRPEIVATYLPKNHLDERINAFSICFSLDGRHLYAGFKDCIRTFDFLRPGVQIQTKSTKGDKSMLNGQKGIISCISICPTSVGLYACGSYNRTVAIYADELKNPQFILQGHSGGVTHLMYSPDGNCLYSGGRKDDEILCWDMRYLGSVLCIFGRQVDTNQRIYFDIDKNGKYLMTGNTNGYVKIWDLASPSECLRWEAHKDCANSVSFNPLLPLIATGSGQRKLGRHFEYFIGDEDDDSELLNKLDTDEICIKLWRIKS